MRNRLVLLPSILLCALVFAAGTAGGHAGTTTAIPFSVENIGFDACADGVFAITFDLLAPNGAPLGRGVSCVHVPSDCPPVAGCRDDVEATFTLALAGGTLTAPVVLHELWATDSKLVQLTRGHVTAGTGAFAGATGSIRCSGVIRFTESEVLPALACLLRLR